MMVQVRKSTISLKAFDVCISETFRNLNADTEFTDVTLVCEDDKQIDAHKVILSNASTFFRRILVRNPHQKPLLYLKGFSYEEVNSIIEFIYLGHTEICQDNISRFISIAVDLEIKGIDDHMVRNETDERAVDVDDKNSSEANLDDVFQEDIFKRNLEKMDDEMGDPINGKEIKEELSDAKNEENVNNSLNGSSSSRSLSISQLRSVCKEAGHYQCIPCEKSFFHKSVLKRHNKAVHDGLRFPCHMCDYKATTQQSLKRHIKNIHGC